MLDLVTLQNAVPKDLKVRLTEDTVDKINKMCEDAEYAKEVTDNFISYASILQHHNWKISDYTSAIGFITYKIMGYSDKDSYIKTFPDRYTRMVSQSYDAKKISSFVSNYKSTQLVSTLIEQTMIPVWLYNKDNYQKAINVQVDLMMTANSEKVRCEAANSVLNHIKKPEKAEIELNIGTEQNTVLDSLNAALLELGTRQSNIIQSGENTSIISKQKIKTVIGE